MSEPKIMRDSGRMNLDTTPDSSKQQQGAGRGSFNRAMHSIGGGLPGGILGFTPRSLPLPDNLHADKEADQFQASLGEPWTTAAAVIGAPRNLTVQNTLIVGTLTQTAGWAVTLTGCTLGGLGITIDQETSATAGTTSAGPAPPESSGSGRVRAKRVKKREVCRE